MNIMDIWHVDVDVNWIFIVFILELWPRAL